MIKRTYFVSYTTGNKTGITTQGWFTVTSKTWFSNPTSVEAKAAKYIKEMNLPNGCVITNLYRIF